jgi:hypothetical protein
MKVLLDECVPRKFKRSLPGHACQTVPEAGLAGQRNGALLLSAERPGFDVFLTVDKGLEFEQNVAVRRIAIAIVHSRSNRLADLAPYAAQWLAEISSAQPGRIHRVGS